MRPIEDALRWHGLNSLRAACSFGDKDSLFVSAMIFSCFLQGKTGSLLLRLRSYESSVKRGVLMCRQPGLNISISRNKVVLRKCMLFMKSGLSAFEARAMQWTYAMSQ